MDNDRFSEWVHSQLEILGKTQRYLSEAMSTSESHVSFILNGKRSMTCEFVLSVADALSVDRLEALRVAGIIPPQPKPDDPQIQETVRLLERIDEAERAFVLRMLRGLTRE